MGGRGVESCMQALTCVFSRKRKKIYTLGYGPHLINVGSQNSRHKGHVSSKRSRGSFCGSGPTCRVSQVCVDKKRKLEELKVTFRGNNYKQGQILQMMCWPDTKLMRWDRKPAPIIGRLNFYVAEKYQGWISFKYLKQKTKQT